ncbi:hypothetical protein OKHIF_02300 [Mycobacteroides chelonae]|jgi:hypothetical protein
MRAKIHFENKSEWIFAFASVGSPPTCPHSQGLLRKGDYAKSGLGAGIRARPQPVNRPLSPQAKGAHEKSSEVIKEFKAAKDQLPQVRPAASSEPSCH